MRQSNELAMIAAVGPGLELGGNGALVWRIPADLKRFRQLTMGHPVIMGRRTWESLPKRPLPGRLNVVVSRSLKKADLPEGAVAASSPEEAVGLCEGLEVPFVIGGAEIYAAFLPTATRLYLTFVDADAPEGVDVWFPEFRDRWCLENASEWMESNDGFRYRFESWMRKN